MKIEILGDGCRKCSSLKQAVIQALAELDLGADLTSVNDPERIAELQVMSLPQLVVDGELLATRSRMSVSEIKEQLSRCR